MSIVDYTFYRIADYYKRKGNSSALSFASSAISVLQCFLILDALVLIKIFYEYPIPQSFNKFWALPVILVIGVINWYRFEKNPRYQELRKRWKDEAPFERRKKGRLLILFIVVTLLLPVLYGVIRNNIMDGRSFIS